jgi:hypothetical protein
MASACATQRPSAQRADSATGADSLAAATAVAVATQRMREHGQAGLSVNDVKRTRDWFTPELYALLIQDMSHPGDIGYLNWDPFTDAQDDVGPSRFEDVRRAGDTIMVRFSREGYQHKRDSVTLAMRRVDGTWRIANFVYSAHTVCDRDLAVGLAREARAIAEKRPPDDAPCRH